MHVGKLGVFRLLVVARIRRDPAGGGLVLRVHEDVSEFWIGGRATPVHGASHAGEGERRGSPTRPIVPWRMRAIVAVLHLVPQRATRFRVRGGCVIRSDEIVAR